PFTIFWHQRSCPSGGGAPIACVPGGHVKGAGPARLQAPNNTRTNRSITLTLVGISVLRLKRVDAAVPFVNRTEKSGRRTGRLPRRRNSVVSVASGQFDPVDPSRFPPSVALPTLVSPITLRSAGLPDLNARSAAGTICSGVSTSSP